jgi:hypothetical protein
MPVLNFPLGTTKKPENRQVHGNHKYRFLQCTVIQKWQSRIMRLAPDPSTLHFRIQNQPNHKITCKFSQYGSTKRHPRLTYKINPIQLIIHQHLHLTKGLDQYTITTEEACKYSSRNRSIQRLKIVLCVPDIFADITVAFKMSNCSTLVSQNESTTHITPLTVPSHVMAVMLCVCVY